MAISQWTDLPLVLTSEQAAQVLQLTRRTITNMLDRGDLRGVKIGKEWRISRAELERFVETSGTPESQGQQMAPVLGLDDTPVVVEQDGILVVQAQPLEDLAEFVQGEHDRRISDLIRQVVP